MNSTNNEVIVKSNTHIQINTLDLQYIRWPWLFRHSGHHFRHQSIFSIMWYCIQRKSRLGHFLKQV